MIRSPDGRCDVRGERRHRDRPTRTQAVVWCAVGAAASGGAVAFFTHDWACSAIGAGAIGGLACGVAALVARRLPMSKWPSRAAIALVAVMLAIGQTMRVEMSYRVEAWTGVFGRLPTGRVREPYEVRRFYAGGPGDRLTLIRFRADPAEIASWVAALPPGDADPLESYRAGTQTWTQFWNGFAWPTFSTRSPLWRDVPAMREPRGYQRSTPFGTGPSASRTIVWDAATGDAFIVFSEG